ncbi:hypothetical protein EST38_g8253 [Candolleomyces aberdarensis]|uniref:Uncharacterized protein n=1 Tax=Candolleomyces aberdarensis TaxID=2316362 RepID=A0A4Q2DCZ2_9AGAR|nr:hypothetical protein EST38_g8253 [Candolleomyces aberdarensis]
MTPPLAGKPPFATEEPDSYYEGGPSPTKRRVAPAKPDNPNKRSSAYDVYDNYLAPGESSNGQRPTSAISTATSRNSGIGGIGMGLLAMDSDDDDDSDDEAYERKRKADKEKREREAASSGQQSKNAALAAAVANGGKPSSPSSSSSSAPNANLNPNAIAPPPTQRSPPPIAAPRPGYAAPAFAQLDSGFGKSPSPVENPFEPSSQPPPQQPQGGMPPPPHMRGPPGPGGPPGPQPRGPPGINMNMMNPNGQGLRQPPPVHGGGPMPPPNAIVRGMTPAPLAPPMTPILPVFAVGPKSTPSPSPGPDGKEREGDGGIKWDDLPTPTPRKPIMRSNTEDALLPRRGEKGDDFWRRFSMIAKVDMAEKSKGGKGSSWLRRTENGKNRLSRWVWVIGILLLCAIGGAIGLGIYFTRDSPDHQQPTALAGNVGNQTAGAAPSTVLSFGGGRGGGGGTPSTATRLHVSPTHTLEGRGFVMAVVPTPATTGAPSAEEKREHAREEHHRRSVQKKRRF